MGTSPTGCTVLRRSNVEEALGTYALASDPGSRINILIMARAGYDQLGRNLLINFYWDSGKMERYVRALSPEEQRVLPRHGAGL